MDNKPVISYKRHIAKTITWRVFSSVINFLIALSLFHKADNASEKVLYVVIFELFFKMFLYYFHERIWYNIKFNFEISSRVRHIAKSISYRFLGSLFTLLITLYIFKGNEEIIFKVSKLITFEIIFKMLMYYTHERVWYRINFGIIKKSDEE